MIHFENIYLGAAGREQQSEKKSMRKKNRGEKKGAEEKRGITRIGSNQGSEITKNPGVKLSGISRTWQSHVLCRVEPCCLSTPTDGGSGLHTLITHSREGRWKWKDGKGRGGAQDGGCLLKPRLDYRNDYLNEGASQSEECRGRLYSPGLPS